MTETHELAEPVDGRVARRQRNIDAVIDVVIEMFAEEAMFPSMEQVATRSGLSLRSLYRYFADPGELLEASIERTTQLARDMSRLDTTADDPFDRRAEEFVDVRLRLHDAFGAVQRATVANAARHPRVRDQLSWGRNDMRRQFLAQFAPELAALKGDDREAVASAGDLLTQLESIDFLRRQRQLSVEEARAALVAGLRALLR